MSMPPQKPTGRYVEGQKNRQILLDYLNANEWATTGDCARHTAALRGFSDHSRENQTVNRRLTKMADIGEVEKRRRNTHHGKQWEWRALVKTTLPATMAAEAVYANISNTVHAKANGGVTVATPGRIVHRGMDRDYPLPSQGGQGAVNWLRGARSEGAAS